VIRALILPVAVVADHIWGEPPRFHPLVGFGKIANFLEKTWNPPEKSSRLHANFSGLLAVLVAIVPFVFLTITLNEIDEIRIILDILVLYLTIAHKSLQEHAMAIYQALKNEDLTKARTKLSLIVSRETTTLSASEISKATIESVLENGSDGIFAAIFWFLILGAPGAIAYRLANTLDAMWGYKNQRFLHFGWAAARLDDVLNYLPSRLTALSYGIAGNAGTAFHAWKTQAVLWYSPNAGPVMAAGAGSLEITLGGNASYHGKLKERPTLGCGREPNKEDILRALFLIKKALVLWVVVSTAIGLAILYVASRR
jgi:adenosylcobinamide-phosphate synthase